MKRAVSGVAAWIVSRLIVLVVIAGLFVSGAVTVGVVFLVFVASLVAALWFALVAGSRREKRSMWKR